MKNENSLGFIYRVKLTKLRRKNDFIGRRVVDQRARSREWEANNVVFGAISQRRIDTSRSHCQSGVNGILVTTARDLSTLPRNPDVRSTGKESLD